MHVVCGSGALNSAPKSNVADDPIFASERFLPCVKSNQGAVDRGGVAASYLIAEHDADQPVISVSPLIAALDT
jgi:hypothetical protein